MDNILDKFGLYDFFGLLLPGMFFIIMLDLIGISNIMKVQYPESEAIKIVAFVLFSYIIGTFMQEVGSLIDDKFIHVRTSARRRYLQKKFNKSSLWRRFTNTSGLGEKEAEKIKLIIKEKMEVDIDPLLKDRDKIKESEKVCEDFFFKCKANIENQGKMGKADKYDAIFAMSRDLIVCNIAIALCIGLFFDECFTLLHGVILGYTLLSSLILFRRAKRYAEMRVRTIFRQYMDINYNLKGSKGM